MSKRIDPRLNERAIFEARVAEDANESGAKPMPDSNGRPSSSYNLRLDVLDQLHQ